MLKIQYNLLKGYLKNTNYTPSIENLEDKKWGVKKPWHFKSDWFDSWVVKPTAVYGVEIIIEGSHNFVNWREGDKVWKGVDLKGKAYTTFKGTMD
jgi:hypothetical protein